MATAAQITANRLNAQASTGPRTEAGKGAVAQNSTTHGLASKNFALLPHEDPAAFAALVEALEAEHQPGTPTESFLVLELARAQWRIERCAGFEADLFAGDPAGLDQGLVKLARYEQAARRAWYQALNQLLKLRSAAETAAVRHTRAYRNEMEGRIAETISAPIPSPPPEAPKYEAKPMPVHLQRELDAHKRRDPLFNPIRDRSQLSGELQRYIDRHPVVW